MTMNEFAITATGEVPADQLGIVMMHEHILHDDVEVPGLFEPLPGDEGERLRDSPVTIEILGKLWRYPLASRANVQFTRRDGIAEELAMLLAAGGRTAVETSTVGLNPDPEGVAEISRASGVLIIMGCGYFVDALIPDWFDELSVDEVAEGLIRDITQGVGETTVRAGIIGEVGTSPDLTEREEKSLRASAIAALETGVSVSVHLLHSVAPGATPDDTAEPGFKALRVLMREGLAPQRIICGHMDEARNVDYAARLIAEGCVVGFDTFGTEWYWDNWKTWEPHDSTRVADVAELCRRGLHESIILSQDVVFKSHLHRWGGLGYDHLLVSIVPMLRDAGVSQEQLDAMLVDTPRRLLTVGYANA
jgi:phosphotriesterase-related protein